MYYVESPKTSFRGLKSMESLEYKQNCEQVWKQTVADYVTLIIPNPRTLKFSVVKVSPELCQAKYALFKFCFPV